MGLTYPSYSWVGFGRTESFESRLARSALIFPSLGLSPPLPIWLQTKSTLVWSRALELTQGKVVCLGIGGICGIGRLLGAM